MTRALIIDDEAPARADLRALLAAHPHVAIVGEAATVSTAKTLLGSADYDLVFLDIQLFGGSGFDLVPFVRPGARIVFVTAFNDHALRAFEVNALDYVLKPVKSERLAASLARALRSTDSTPPAAVGLRRDDKVHLNDGQRARFANVSEISRIEAEENYTHVQLVDGTQMLVRRTIKSWEETLPSPPFQRVHRTTIANLERVTAYDRTGRVLTLRLAGVGEPVGVSRQASAAVKDRLDQLFPRP
ncbi:MAG: response regulator transcription factor [Opitutae bacterium]|nr:response regulator transcription factor [Opitutae bacterium]